jgi:hypothetical protein
MDTILSIIILTMIRIILPFGLILLIGSIVDRHQQTSV